MGSNPTECIFFGSNESPSTKAKGKRNDTVLSDKPNPSVQLRTGIGMKKLRSIKKFQIFLLLTKMMGQFFCFSRKCEANCVHFAIGPNSLFSRLLSRDADTFHIHRTHCKIQQSCRSIRVRCRIVSLHRLLIVDRQLFALSNKQTTQRRRE